jgi:preprotein translocase subunit YajC
MEEEEITFIESQCITEHKKDLEEQMHRAVAKLIFAHVGPIIYGEHFSTLSKQIRVYDNEYQNGDLVKTIDGTVGTIHLIKEESPNEIFSIADLNGSLLVQFDKSQIKHLCSGDKFNEFDPDDLLPF